MLIQTDGVNALENPYRPKYPWAGQNIEPPVSAAYLDGSKLLWRAALEAEERGTPDASLRDIWLSVSRGELRAWWESIGPDRILLVARHCSTRTAMTSEEQSIVARVFAGEQQKVLASDLAIAASTVSGRFVRALAKLDLVPRAVPVSLVLAAQTFAGMVPVGGARRAAFEHRGTKCLAISVPRPVTRRLSELTPAEQTVAQWIIEGRSRLEVAARRRTSVHTVARQFHAIFSRLGITGRCALIGKALESGCFS
jgi:DNA-binding NarL/FixJ family response regulator